MKTIQQCVTATCCLSTCHDGAGSKVASGLSHRTVLSVLMKLLLLSGEQPEQRGWKAESTTIADQTDRGNGAEGGTVVR